MATTIAGGRYKVGDRWVNANGDPIKAAGTPDEPTAEEQAQQREAELLAAHQQLQAQLAGIMSVLTPEQIKALQAQPAATTDDGKTTTRRSRSGDKGEEK